MKMGPIGCPKMSVINQPTLCNNPENGRIQLNYNGSLQSRLFFLIIQGQVYT
jgi:hypothetical protein